MPESRKKDNIKSSSYHKGKEAEEAACKFLISKNYHILHTNWRCSLGEIDIIARHNSCLCFIEVKFRKNNSFGFPKEAVDYKKKKKLIELARAYLAAANTTDENVRFDVVEAGSGSMGLIQNAFSADD